MDRKCMKIVLKKVFGMVYGWDGIKLAQKNMRLCTRMASKSINCVGIHLRIVAIAVGILRMDAIEQIPIKYSHSRLEKINCFL